MATSFAPLPAATIRPRKLGEERLINCIIGRARLASARAEIWAARRGDEPNVAHVAHARAGAGPPPAGLIQIHHHQAVCALSGGREPVGARARELGHRLPRWLAPLGAPGARDGLSRLIESLEPRDAAESAIEERRARECEIDHLVSNRYTGSTQISKFKFAEPALTDPARV